MHDEDDTIQYPNKKEKADEDEHFFVSCVEQDKKE